MQKENSESRIRFSYIQLILFGIIAFFITTNIIWIAKDTLPPVWDANAHMANSLTFYRMLCGQPSLKTLERVFSMSFPYLPFFHLTAFPVIYVLGFSEDTMLYVNFLYIPILVLSLFGIGRILFNARVGILSCFLLIFYPIVFGISRMFMLDFALLAMVTQAQYLILKREEEGGKAWLLLCALITAALIKKIAFIFLVPTMAALFLRKLYKKKKIDFFILFLILFLFFIFLITLNRPQFKGMFTYKEGTTLLSLLMMHLSYLKWFIIAARNNMSPLLSFFFWIGLISLLCIFKKKKMAFLFLMSWLIPAFFVFSTINFFKDGRYIMSALPPFAILTMGGIEALPEKHVRNFFYSFIIAIGFLQFMNLSFNMPPLLVNERNYHYNHSAVRQNWRSKEVVEYIRAHSGEKTLRIGVLANTRYFSHSTLYLHIKAFELPYSMDWFWLLEGSESDTKRLKKYDFFIVKVPYPTEWIVSREYWNIKFDEREVIKLGFQKVKEFNLPDGSKAMIYQKEKKEDPIAVGKK